MLAPVSTPPPLLLASGSPRRAELLRAALVDFEVGPVDCDETWRAGEAPLAYVQRLAREKAQLALQRGYEGLVLAADTAVWTDEALAPLGKPSDRDEARRMLTDLFARRQHFVSTAFALVDGRAAHAVDDASRARELVVTTRVWMRALQGESLARVLERYLNTDEWTDKAGGYGIQGHAAGLVERIDGSYTAVVGLPLAEVLDALADICQPR